MNKDWSTPVLILNCKIGALGIMRSLGKLGVPVYGVNEIDSDAELTSRYLKQYFIKEFDPGNQQDYLEYVIALSKIIGGKPVLIPTSDELSLFVAKNKDILNDYFLFSANTLELIDNLSDKQKMFHLALEHNIPTPGMISPKTFDELQQCLDDITYPVMLKGIDGTKLFKKTGKKMVIINNEDELLENFRQMNDPTDPNIMLQELIPGDDDQVYIFNGYFNEDSECLAAYTGHKIRQFPIHVGCASLGECRWNERVAIKTQDFMKAVGYKGILDIGYRYDARDDKYKVLDINPRVGQAFRMFVSENDMDVIKSLYLDLTDQSQPEIIPREGRRWIIEDLDIISTYDYFCEGTLSVKNWMLSFRGLQEAAWFSWSDPKPFIINTYRLGLDICKALVKRIKNLFS